MLSLILSTPFLIAAAIGVAALILQTGTVLLYAPRRTPLPKSFPGISVLKPLCGADDRLEENLKVFAELDYPNYEVVLGLKDINDAAYPIAIAATQKWPGKFRLEMQRSEPGFNPKVNQLITLQEASRYDILVVSDSNTQVDKDYLTSIAYAFEDERVAAVTHPVVGKFEKKLGARLDNLHLTCCVGAGQISAKLLAGKDVVIGKSLAFKRADLEAMGGFYAMRNYLAEDFIIGRWVKEKLTNKRVALAIGRVINVSENKDISDFFTRHKRWGIVQRTAVSMITNIGQICMNPVPLLTVALLLNPNKYIAAFWLVALGVRLTADLTSSSLLRRQPPELIDVLAIVLKDFFTFSTWCRALVVSTVVWRGNTLRVLPGSRLVPVNGRGNPPDDGFEEPEDTHPAAGAA